MIARLVIVLALGCGCGGVSSSQLAKPGTYAAGVRTYTFVDTTRTTPPNHDYQGAPTRTLTVEVWYPTEGDPAADPMRGATPSGGVFPLVVHSHGFMDGRLGESYLGQHLATRGYVVAAPDFPLSNGNSPGGATFQDTPNQPLDVRFVIDQLLAGELAPSIDANRIGISGLSLGGLTALLTAFHPRLRDPRVKAAMTLAAPACFLLPAFYQNATLPLLLVQGDADLLVPIEQNGMRAFQNAQNPKELVTLARGSHTGFTGLATLFDSTMNYDRIGCRAIAGHVDVSSFTELGSDAEGISSDMSMCPMPCLQPPQDPSLLADRQQELTTVLATAFFDGALDSKSSEQQFLRGTVATQNAELTVHLP
jgi:predicted dienelactone hydrolase